MLFVEPPCVLTAQQPRRGIVLLVVMAMLVLFASLALAFVFYANSEATASRYNRDAQDGNRSFQPDMDPEMAFAYFLGQVLYDVPDDSNGVASSLRGHSLARGLYGYNYLWVNQYGVNYTSDWNTVPFNGLGRQHTNAADPQLSYQNPYTQDDYNLINYMYYQKGLGWLAADGFVRDPERLSSRASPTAPPNAFYGGVNAGYTYPDLNNMMLGAINSNGEVLIQSGYRSWTGIGSLDKTTNPLWADPATLGTAAAWNTALNLVPASAKYATLRPMSWYHNDGNSPPVKYFPPPADGGGDVKNWEAGPGVPIPGQPGKYYANDSIWIDIGTPVQVQTSTGLKYKMLVAPLIVDLDGKINLNIHGNARGTGLVHVSNMAWGPSEVNPAWVLDPTGTLGQTPKLLLGNGTVYGRYGKDQQPSTAGTVAPPGTDSPGPPFYANADLDAVQSLTGAPATGYTPSTAWYLPGVAGNTNTSAANGNGNYVPFPFFPAASYENGQNNERLNHPLLFNPFIPTGDDLPFSAAELELPYRFGGTNTLSLTSKFFTLAPKQFVSATPLPAYRQVTTHSVDLDRAGAYPWLVYTGDYKLKQAASGTFTVAASPGYPQPAAVNTSSTNNSGEFFANSRRGRPGSLLKVNLNRTLTNYPTVPANGFIDTSVAATMTLWQQAVSDRQQLAKDIFERLRWVATGNPPGTAIPAPGGPPESQEYSALRWLAQLAVNIVDYRDADDYITPFNWDTTNYLNNAQGYVYGTELPQAVMNEVYAEVANDPADLGMAMASNPYRVNFWIELLNPRMQDANHVEPISGQQSATRLYVPAPNATQKAWAVYQVIVAKEPLANTSMRALNNTTGAVNAADVTLQVQDYTPDASQTTVLTGDSLNYIQALNAVAANNCYSGTQGKNEGFYVMSSKYDFQGKLPTAMNPAVLKPTLPVNSASASGATNNLSYTIPNTTNLTLPLPKHTMVLQRLACPYLPPNTTLGSPTYNPYITVDWLEHVLTTNDVAVTPTGPVAAATMPAWWANLQSSGRSQPYTAITLQQRLQAPNPALANQPQNTFFRQNAVEAAAPPSAATANQTLTLPMDWLVHKDRVLVNPMELLHVSAYPPSLLTHQFLAPGTGTKFSHYAPWFDQSARIYRAFEYLEIEPRVAGTTQGGRFPGKMNLNTVWSKDSTTSPPQDAGIFTALCDPNSSSSFNSTDVNNIFSQLISGRTPNLIPGANDRPFMSLATGVIPTGDLQWPNGPYPNGAGMNNTLLRDNTASGSGTSTTPRLFELPTPSGVASSTTTHPARKYELLSKIFNNVTTRSNVYAVWLTVGFFEVIDDSVQPVKLGAEIGASQNRQIRHRSFGIVDRSNMAMPALLTTTSGAVAAPPILPTPNTPQTIPLSLTTPQTVPTAIMGTSSVAAPVGVTMNWAIQAGTRLVIDAGVAGKQETITVQSVTSSPPTITALFTNAHANGATVTVPGQTGPQSFSGQATVLGNPGPQPLYNPHNNTTVVLYFTVIQ